MRQRVVPLVKRPEPCRKCGEVLNAHAGDAMPEPGDVSICAHCLCASIFDDDLSLRAPRTLMEHTTIADAWQRLLSEQAS